MSVFLNKDQIDLMAERNRHLGSRNGMPVYKRLLVHEHNGFGIMLQHICAGNVSGPHTHGCGHGMYVLAGTLHTNFGEFEPGSFVWFPAGVEMEHGAVGEDVDLLFITDAPFDIEYLGEDAELPATDPRFAGVHGSEVALAYRSDDTARVYGRTTLYESPTLGFEVKLQHFEPGAYTPWHTHSRSHGMYVLDGELVTSEGRFGEDSFVWFDAGTTMEHGTREQSADLLFITDGPFDITFE